MARYTGPVCKLCRREGIKLFLKGERCFTPKCAVDPNRRPYPPGPQRQRRRKVSEYGVQLREKQKVRHIYGVLENQFRRHFEEAERRPGQTGENLLRILEMRLDNIVFRMGFADSRAQARQLVTHGHFQLNGRKTNVPSAEVKPGAVISLTPRARELEYFKAAQESMRGKQTLGWITVDLENMAGRVLAAPSRPEIDVNVQEQLIVEYYSR